MRMAAYAIVFGVALLVAGVGDRGDAVAYLIGYLVGAFVASLIITKGLQDFFTEAARQQRIKDVFGE